MAVQILLLSMYNNGFTDTITLNCYVFQRLHSSLRQIFIIFNNEDPLAAA